MEGRIDDPEQLVAGAAETARAYNAAPAPLTSASSPAPGPALARPAGPLLALLDEPSNPERPPIAAKTSKSEEGSLQKSQIRKHRNPRFHLRCVAIQSNTLQHHLTFVAPNVQLRAMNQYVPYNF
jgi:hypothetical protein